MVMMLVSPNSHAFERQWRAGAGGGFASFSKFDSGPSANLHGAYGLSDMFDVNLELGASRHGPKHWLDVLHGSLGASYKIDVLSFIPYVGATGGYYYFPNLVTRKYGRGAPGFSLMYGIDYSPSRQLAFGLQIKNHGLLADGLNMPMSQFLLRAEYRWGF